MSTELTIQAAFLVWLITILAGGEALSILTTKSY